MFFFGSSPPVQSVKGLLLVASWFYSFGTTGRTGSWIGTEKSWSANNIQIIQASINTPISDNGTSTLPRITATTVFDLSDIQYLIQDSPDVIIRGIYTAVYSNC